jgi:hypothetical protein
MAQCVEFTDIRNFEAETEANAQFRPARIGTRLP